MNRRGLARCSVLALLLLPLPAPAFGAGMITGLVADRDGNPVPNLTVVLTPGEQRARTYRPATNAKGRFSVRVDNGRYEITVGATDRDIDTATVRIMTERREPVDEYSGRIVPGGPPVVVVMENDRFIEVEIVVADPATLRAEHAQILLAQVAEALRGGDRDRARSTVESLLENSPGDPVGLTLRAFIALEDGDLASAESDLKQALDEQPDMLDANYLLAAVHQRTDRPAEAREGFERVVALAPGTETAGKAWLSIAQIERDAGRVEEAIAAFEKAVEAWPALESQVAPEVASLYSTLQRTEEAERWLAKVEAEADSDPSVQYNIAAGHFNRGEWDEAVEWFRKVLAVDPGFADAHQNLAYALINKGEMDAAKEHLRRYLELRPDAADAADVKQLLEALGG